MVAFGQRVGDAKVIVIKINTACCNIKRKAKAAGWLGRSGPYIDFNALLGVGGLLVEITDHPSQ